jgi:hypothetical protein
MRTFKFFALASLLAAGLTHAPEAWAAKKGEEAADPCKVEAPKITNSGIPEMDEVFTKAATIQDTVAGQTGKVCTARGQLNSALGVAADAPIKTALADLQTKAAGKLQVAMDGAKPSLKATDAVPANVQAAIDAVNALIDTSAEAAKETAGLLPEAKGLATTAAGFPMKVPTIKVTGVDIPTAIKVVGENVKAIKQLPNQIEGLGAQMNGIVTDLKATFGG